MSVIGWLKEIFVERFWLRRAERMAKSYAPEQRESVRRLERAARARASAAAELRSPEQRGPAFALMREAFALLVSALLVGRGEHDGARALGAREAWQKLGELASSLPGIPDLAPLEPLLSTDDTLVPDGMAPAEALALRPRFEQLLAWLDTQSEVRSVRWLKTLRVLRVVGLVLALATVVTGGLLLGHGSDAPASSRAAGHRAR